MIALEKQLRLAHDPDIDAGGTLPEAVAAMALVPAAHVSNGFPRKHALAVASDTLKGSWSGPGRLELVPHVNAPVADLPLRRIVEAHHFVADVTLPWGRVVHDYLAP